MAGWPSGLRRQFQVIHAWVRKYWSSGVGSNPTPVKSFHSIIIIILKLKSIKYLAEKCSTMQAEMKFHLRYC